MYAVFSSSSLNPYPSLQQAVLQTRMLAFLVGFFFGYRTFAALQSRSRTLDSAPAGGPLDAGVADTSDLVVSKGSLSDPITDSVTDLESRLALATARAQAAEAKLLRGAAQANGREDKGTSPKPESDSLAPQRRQAACSADAPPQHASDPSPLSPGTPTPTPVLATLRCSGVPTAPEDQEPETAAPITPSQILAAPLRPKLLRTGPRLSHLGLPASFSPPPGIGHESTFSPDSGSGEGWGQGAAADTERETRLGDAGGAETVLEDSGPGSDSGSDTAQLQRTSATAAADLAADLGPQTPAPPPRRLAINLSALRLLAEALSPRSPAAAGVLRGALAGAAGAGAGASGLSGGAGPSSLGESGTPLLSPISTFGGTPGSREAIREAERRNTEGLQLYKAGKYQVRCHPSFRSLCSWIHLSLRNQRKLLRFPRVICQA